MRHLVRTTRFALAAIGVQAVMVFAFTAPAAHTAPHRIPLAVAAPAAQRAVIEQRLNQAAPGAFAVREVPDESAARTALTDRDAYGAVIATAQGSHMLVASAASPTVAAMLTEVGSHLAQATAATSTAEVTDVIPAAANDPHGGAFTSMILPMVISSLIGGVLLTLKLPRLRDRALGAVLFAFGGGAAVALIASHTLAFLPGSYLALTAAIAAPVLAVAAFTIAMASLIGQRGFALSGLTMMLLANPLSAASSAPEMLPTPWGTVGQDLPAGAAATLIRSTAFFDGRGSVHAVVVLSLWIAAAGAMLTAAGLRAARVSRAVTAAERVARAAETATV
ncbi:MAG: hypothetical protein JF587_20765 [Catenulisporales bacterium]|nr:hypothetical protein [Catenulisporales bacterium]